MTDPAAWPAPAKLNLMLRVLGRRADGYHLLQTVFQFVDLHDDLYFDVRPDGEIRRRSELPGVAPHQDLVVRAALLLQRHTGCSLGADIHVTKRLPMGGGLGGGSSDAATTLVALNQLWGCGLGRDELMRLGQALGADVPVFVFGQAAWAEGVGERLTAIEPPRSIYLLLLPGVHVDTGKVFQDPELTRNSDPTTIRDFVAGDHRNDCLAVVLAGYPKVRQAYEWLDKNGDARLTGTGACVFTPCADRDAAQRLLRCRPPGVAGYVVQGLNRSPLLDRLEGTRHEV